MLVTYLYLLRVPIVGGLVLAGFAPFALMKGTNLTTLLEGMFDLDAWRIAVVAFVALLAASACAICSELVLRYGAVRFAVAPLPAWLERRVFDLFGVPIDRLSLLTGGAAALCALSLLIGLVYGAREGSMLSRLAGAGAGVLVFAGVLRLIIRVWATGPPAVSRYATAVFRWTPDGYIDPASRDARTRADKVEALRQARVRVRAVHTETEWLLPGHGFAIIAAAVTVVVYGTLGISKWWAMGQDRPAEAGALPAIPTLACVLLLITLVTYLCSGAAFLMDRFRVPFVVPLALVVFASSDWPQSDHYFETRARAETLRVSPAAVLDQSPHGRAIVVATSGGGIQAAAWTGAVLARLQIDTEGAFAREVRAISAVSGGSVGAMYFVDAFRDGTIDVASARARLFDSAAASSLDDIAWGLIYPDFIRLFVPFIGRADRGWAAEQAWRRFGNVDRSLSSWRPDTLAGRRPAVLFNATVAENGSRFVLATTDLEARLRGRMSFSELYADRDVAVATAARLSATFPYVGPAARSGDWLPVSRTFHFVDGGYYDNFGISSISDWLREAMPPEHRRVTRILLLQIRGPIGVEDAPAAGRRRGFFYQASVPPGTVIETRTTGQISHNAAELRLLCEVARARGVTLDTVVFQYPYADTPLSWHLTRPEREAVWTAYDRCRDGETSCARKVRDFMTDGPPSAGCAQFEEPRKLPVAQAAR